MTEALVVGGLEVPDDLLWVAESIEWTRYSEESRLEVALVESVFGEAPDPGWRFYTTDEIVGMAEHWHAEQDASWFGREGCDIQPARSVLIGELGYDRPFALDYRAETPCVRFMTIDARWIRAADSVTDLLRRLGISKR